MDLKLEVHIGRAVVEHFEARGWDVYQEVSHGPGVADVVAMRQQPGFARELAVIECKRSLGFDVLAQAYAWEYHAPMVWAAVGRAKNSPARQLARKVFADLGVGLIEVSENRDRAIEVVQPRIRLPSLGDALAASLRPEHKTFAKAGTNRGGHWTEYKATCTRLLAVVTAQPGVTLTAAIKAIEHHYASKASARSTLKRRAELGEIPGIELRGACLYLKGTS